ncbi:hypothetical protein ANO11243_035380 [Dothideomycetidae sp. 11243]|nr:hypothetical protein ANO11243_035380 [fungal sp. No.11243]
MGNSSSQIAASSSTDLQALQPEGASTTDKDRRAWFSPLPPRDKEVVEGLTPPATAEGKSFESEGLDGRGFVGEELGDSAAVISLPDEEYPETEAVVLSLPDEDGYLEDLAVVLSLPDEEDYQDDSASVQEEESSRTTTPLPPSPRVVIVRQDLSQFDGAEDSTPPSDSESNFTDDLNEIPQVRQRKLVAREARQRIKAEKRARKESRRLQRRLLKGLPQEEEEDHTLHFAEFEQVSHDQEMGENHVRHTPGQRSDSFEDMDDPGTQLRTEARAAAMQSLSTPFSTNESPSDRAKKAKKAKKKARAEEEASAVATQEQGEKKSKKRARTAEGETPSEGKSQKKKKHKHHDRDVASQPMPSSSQTVVASTPAPSLVSAFTTINGRGNVRELPAAASRATMNGWAALTAPPVSEKKKKRKKKDAKADKVVAVPSTAEKGESSARERADAPQSIPNGDVAPTASSMKQEKKKAKDTNGASAPVVSPTTENVESAAREHPYIAQSTLNGNVAPTASLTKEKKKKKKTKDTNGDAAPVVSSTAEREASIAREYPNMSQATSDGDVAPTASVTNEKKKKRKGADGNADADQVVSLAMEKKKEKKSKKQKSKRGTESTQPGVNSTAVDVPEEEAGSSAISGATTQPAEFMSEFQEFKKKMKAKEREKASKKKKPKQPPKAAPASASKDTSEVTRQSEEPGVTGRFHDSEIHIVDAQLAIYGEQHGYSEDEIKAFFNGKNGMRDARRSAICEFVNLALPDRSRKSVRQFLSRKLNDAKGGGWTGDQDEELREAYQKKPGAWTVIGELIGRMPEDCRDRWRDFVGIEGRKTGEWKQHETDKLKEAVTTAIARIRKDHKIDAAVEDSTIEDRLNWRQISEMIGGKRSRLQCSYKWAKLKKQKLREESGKPAKRKRTTSEKPKETTRKKRQANDDAEGVAGPSDPNAAARAYKKRKRTSQASFKSSERVDSDDDKDEEGDDAHDQSAVDSERQLYDFPNERDANAVPAATRDRTSTGAQPESDEDVEDDYLSAEEGGSHAESIQTDQPDDYVEDATEDVEMRRSHGSGMLTPAATTDDHDMNDDDIDDDDDDDVSVTSSIAAYLNGTGETRSTQHDRAGEKEEVGSQDGDDTEMQDAQELDESASMHDSSSKDEFAAYDDIEAKPNVESDAEPSEDAAPEATPITRSSSVSSDSSHSSSPASAATPNHSSPVLESQLPPRAVVSSSPELGTPSLWEDTLLASKKKKQNLTYSRSDRKRSSTQQRRTSSAGSRHSASSIYAPKRHDDPIEDDDDDEEREVESPSVQRGRRTTTRQEDEDDDEEGQSVSSPDAGSDAGQDQGSKAELIVLESDEEEASRSSEEEEEWSGDESL